MKTPEEVADEMVGEELAAQPEPKLRRCNKWECDEVELVWLLRGRSHQTDNGFYTIKITGYYCPLCGAGYGK